MADGLIPGSCAQDACTGAGEGRSPDAGGGPEPIAWAEPVVWAVVTGEPLDLRAHERAVRGDAFGAIVSFAGVVRDHDGGHAVRELEYVGHPSAGRVLREVADTVVEQHPGVTVAVSHRLGLLAIGDLALAVAVAAAHRAEAFTVAALLVDEIKRALPIWKRQVFADGSHEWVACP